MDGAGRIFVPWSEVREPRPDEPPYERGFMSRHARGWRTTALWDWEKNAYFAATAVSSNGRAVAIRTVTNARETRTTVVMRVLHPG
jgi:hypothetical protein